MSSNRLTAGLDDTIAAIASAPGGAGRAIVRVSGLQALACVDACFSADDRQSLASRTATQIVPGNVAVWQRLLPVTAYIWPSRRSYTREPVVELHTLGSPPVVDSLLRAICAAGARLAEPGEFTLRAFLAGRLDLTQAEAVLGVIDAADRRELQTALAQLAGGLTQPLSRLRESLLDLLAELEAGLDFVEEDIKFISRQDLEARLAAAAAQVEALLQKLTGRGESAHAVRVVLLGWPNVGKSQLFNALAGDGQALVSDIPGTTRDYLTARVHLHGVACELVDTAGFEPRSAANSVSSVAQDMTARQHREAHLELLCLDRSRPLNSWEEAKLSEPAPQRLVVLTKVDVVSETTSSQLLTANLPPEAISTSSKTGEGLETLRTAIATAASGCTEALGVVAGTSLRCRESLRLTAESLALARDLAGQGDGEELIAAETRAALHELGQVVGAIYNDDVLDRIFSRFCIGK